MSALEPGTRAMPPWGGGHHRGAGGPGAAGPWEGRALLAAVLLALCHAVDDAVVHRQPGVPVSQHAPALAVATVLAGAALVAFVRCRAGVRAAIAFTLGVLTATDGATHVLHLVSTGGVGSDFTGAAAAVAGAALVVLGIAIPFHHRGTAAPGFGRRWATRASAGVAMATWTLLVLAPVAVAIGQTHMPRQQIGRPPDRSWSEVSFDASDGLRLSGWYRPSVNGAAVVVVATSRGDRTSSVQHARLLGSHGYGVLVYDARGTGRSEGSPNGYGWDWDRDVRGALSFLQRRPDVDPRRIGGLGLSTGADVLLEAAAEDHDLAAVVSDGATGRSASDVATVAISDRPALWVTFAAVRLLSGTSPGPPLRTLVTRISPTPLLLIAAGSIPQEIPFNTDYAAAAREPVELWSLPHVHHTAAIREAPAEYERRVTTLFDQALRP